VSTALAAHCTLRLLDPGVGKFGRLLAGEGNFRESPKAQKAPTGSRTDRAPLTHPSGLAQALAHVRVVFLAVSTARAR
jgi:hypothetical protein